jgi:hypothetical protein
MMTTKLERLYDAGTITAYQLRAGDAFAHDHVAASRGARAVDTTRVPSAPASGGGGSNNTAAASRRLAEARAILSQESLRVVTQIAVREGDIVDAMQLVEASREKTLGYLRGGLDVLGQRVYALT